MKLAAPLSAILCLLFFSTSAQNINPEYNYKFSLFAKNVHEVSVKQLNVVKEVWRLNPKNHTLKVYQLQPKSNFADYYFDNKNMPEFDENYFATDIKTYYFKSTGQLDSIITNAYKVAFFGEHEKNGPFGDRMVGKVTTETHKTLFSYKNNCLAKEKRWMNTDFFTGFQNITKFTCTNKKPVLASAYNGELTINYTYDEAGRLTQQSDGKRFTYSYFYNDYGLLIEASSTQSKTVYTYNENNLLDTELRPDGIPAPYLYAYN